MRELLIKRKNFIADEERFMDHVALAAQAVAHAPRRIVMLAMEAEGPEEEYGYIVPAPSADRFDLFGLRHAARFIEKPDRRLARELIAAGQRLFGENRVQEAKAKWPALAQYPSRPVKVFALPDRKSTHLNSSHRT